MIMDSESNLLSLPLLNDQLRLSVDASNRFALSGNMPPQFHGVPVNFVGNHSIMPMELLSMNNMETLVMAMQEKSQNTQISGRKNEVNPNFSNQNQVATGLSLYHEVSGQNLSPKSENEIFCSLINDIRSQFELEASELYCFMASQGDKMAKGLHDISKKHANSLKAALEKAYSHKLHEKDLELGSLLHKNKQLSETIKQQTEEAHKWRRIASYNESVVKTLKHKLQQACDLGKEGFGEHDPRSTGPMSKAYSDMDCRCCGGNMASVLLMPCRHLCLCRECDCAVNVCPVCMMIKASSLEVYLC